MVSVLRSWKGHTTFLQAARQLRDAGFRAHFLIVGDGPMRPAVEKEVADLKLAEAVTLAGHREDVPEVLRALDVLVIASTRHEGVPQIGLQALATRTPVVGSDVGGTPEIIRPGETGRNFRAEDVGALARTIRETVSEAEATRAMCERGRMMVEQHHSLDAMLDQLDGIYHRYLPG
jgi:glycosyltransferase involved in cell wall biosynthesis